MSFQSQIDSTVIIIPMLKIVILLSCFFIFPLEIYTQNSIEICDNAIDDDGNGLIDAFDPACNCGNADNQNLIPNPQFFDNRGCCKFTEGPTANCLTEWQFLKGTPEYYDLDCLPDFAGYGAHQLYQTNDSTMMRLTARGDQTPVTTDMMGICLDNPIVAGQRYSLEVDLARYTVWSIDSPIRLSFFGEESCNNWDLYRVDILPCAGLTEENHLASFDLSQMGRDMVRYQVSFTARQDFSALIIGFPCEDIGDDDRAVAFMDNLSLTPLDSELDYTSEITQSSTQCGDNISLSVADDPTLQYQWYKDSIPVDGAHSATYFPEINSFQSAYSVWVSNGNSCTTLGPYQMEIVSTETTITASTCTNEGYLFANQLRYTTGIYRDTIPTASGCDNITILNLSVFESIDHNLEVDMCEGATYDFNGRLLNTSGVYFDTLQTTMGCDSSIQLQLQIHSPVEYQFSDVFCGGDSYDFNGRILNHAGTYRDTLTTATFCDSIVTLRLSVVDAITFDFSEQICTGSTYNFNGRSLSSSGVYMDTLQNIVGCDSIVTLNLEVIDEIHASLTETICMGATYTFNEQNLTSAGVYLDTLASVLGCDSIVRLDLRVQDRIVEEINTEMCTGGVYIFNNQSFYHTGTYIDTVVNSMGCEEILILNLSVLPSVNYEYSEQICAGESYLFDNQYLTTTGDYQTIIPAASGCDSIVMLHLEVIPVPENTVTQAQICQGDSYHFNQQTLTREGVYFDTLHTDMGCDSVIMLQLIVLDQLIGDTTQVSIATDESYDFHQQNYTTSGFYTATLTSANGCDSLVFLDLTVVMSDPCATAIVFEPFSTPTTCSVANNGSIQINTTAHHDDYLYSINGGQSFQTEPIFNQLANGDYAVVIEDINGCLSATQTVTIATDDTTILEIELPKDQNAMLGDSLTIAIENANFTPTRYEWQSDQSITCDTCDRLMVSAIETTDYQLIAWDKNGCSATDELTIFVDQRSFFYLPNAFSPNGDDVNDFLTFGSRPDYIQQIDYFSVFNRWGELIFEQKGVSPNNFKGWDGKYKGQAMSNGIYVYIAQVTNKMGRIEQLSGEVVLIR